MDGAAVSLLGLSVGETRLRMAAGFSPVQYSVVLHVEISSRDLRQAH